MLLLYSPPERKRRNTARERQRYCHKVLGVAAGLPVIESSCPLGGNLLVSDGLKTAREQISARLHERTDFRAPPCLEMYTTMKTCIRRAILSNLPSTISVLILRGVAVETKLRQGPQISKAQFIFVQPHSVQHSIILSHPYTSYTSYLIHHVRSSHYRRKDL